MKNESTTWFSLSEFDVTLYVRLRGLEPPHLAILGPKPSASANSATSAYLYLTITQVIGRVNFLPNVTHLMDQ